MERPLDQLWESIQNAPPERKRAAYLESCQLAIDAVESGQLDVRDAAYGMCGMAAQVLDYLSAEDREIMAIASDLELPDAHRARPASDWQVLVEKVRDLRHSAK